MSDENSASDAPSSTQEIEPARPCLRARIAGDYRSFEPQLPASAAAPLLTYSQRGYPPSECRRPARYSQDIARDDVVAVMDCAG